MSVQRNESLTSTFLLAAPPTVPKHFTDEELKQQYGIHLATRLQADGDGKEAKWADIDDDEDDWAPETIEWNDGTKITLSHNDPAAVLAEEQAAALAMKERQEEQNRTKMPPPKPTTTVGPNATVLRLGSGGPPRTGGLVLKNPSDKPTLVAKPPAPAPVRSPWAQLPPVDKVPPVPINPPAQSPAPRSQHPVSSGPEGMATPTSTTMEIAADSFTRTRRDTQNGSHGQLYNSQSGQYEPVNAPRRASMRKEQNFRPPAVLQRPSHNEQHGPAEPSAAFQTHRSGGQQDGNLWNRRASSTMSGDSGPQGRRASMSRGSEITRIPHELLQQRRESQPLQSPLTPSPSQGRFSQQENGSSQTHPQQSLLQSTATLSSQQGVEASTTKSQPQSKPIPYGSLAASRTDDDVAAQKELMKEKRAMAIKRKKEEEEREAFEKQERVRLNMLKLEKLGINPPDVKKESDKTVQEKRESETTVPEEIEANSKEAEMKKAEPIDTGLKAVKLENPLGLNQPPEVTDPRSPPKPPVLDASGTPKQYGLMKMHGPPLTNGVQPNIERHVEVAASTQQGAASSVEVNSKITQPTTSPKTNGDISVKKVDSHISPSPETRTQDLFKTPRQQPWKNIQNDADSYSGWNGSGMTTHSSQVGSLWGPPTSFKSLGNGTFDRSVQRPQSRQPFQEHYPTPQPIGPPKHLQRPRESPEPSRAPDLIIPTSTTEESPQIPTHPSSEVAAPLLANRSNAASQSGNGETPILPSPPNPVNPQKPEVDAERLSRVQDQRSTLAAWGNFHITAAREDAAKSRHAAQEKAARLAEETRTGIRREISGPVLNETWRQVVVNDKDNKRQVVNSAKNVHDPLSEEHVNGDIRNSPFANPSNVAIATGVGRGSRFFPGAGQGLQPQSHSVISFSLEIHRPVSPPPPDSIHHPAYFRDQQRPLVNLPSPKPTVKLPPPSATPVHPPTMVNVPIVPLRAVSQPLVNNVAWQDKFNGLLGVKKPSPEKKFAHVAEFSVTTKVPLEAPMVRVSAAVSLPAREEDGFEPITDGEVISKATEDEEALFENREFGSLPTVLLPTQVPQAVRQRSGKTQSRGLARAKEVDPESLRNIEDKENDFLHATVIFVKLIGMDSRKSKAVPRLKGYPSNQGPFRYNRHPPTNPKSGKGFKSRESSGGYNTAQKPSQQNNTLRNPISNGVNPQTRSQFGKHHTN